jgi:hypothetical protein
MQTQITARELDTELARIELENVAHKLYALADKAQKNSPKFADIADGLAEQIHESLQQLQLLIAAENED